LSTKLSYHYVYFRHYIITKNYHLSADLIDSIAIDFLKWSATVENEFKEIKKEFIEEEPTTEEV